MGYRERKAAVCYTMKKVQNDVVVMLVSVAVVMLVSVARADAQPGRRGPFIGAGLNRGGPVGAGGTGAQAATGCTISSGTCARDGSSNFVDSSALSYSASTGKFTGSMKYNGCLNHESAGLHSSTASCQQKSFPSARGPSAAPLLGAVGLSRFGVLIYGPFEAGFGSAPASSSFGTGGGARPAPNPCSSGSGGGPMSGTHGFCAGGIDVQACEDGLKETYGEENTLVELFMDACGGHAQPYHYHTDLRCSYIPTTSPHAPLLGFAHDGHGLYGLSETGTEMPEDLDACNGHFGVVPADNALGVAASSTPVYHYHTTLEPPFTIGCFGPVDSLRECTSFYDGCADGNERPMGEIVNNGIITGPSQTPYKPWCPCFPQNA